ncbi:bifunctional folylpolyglutamate synthase/dihydrofolate synthase [Anaerostipes amylophilus]|uniref:bifunctional folylpolyglutamate synthase/dihydrofolate synthase n=1 Tax=Anaerostipes amylophilus TaxID=2981779 RepID=UPI0006C42D79|nr:folylpolyglutamate synthase/dihydrofolate synthase family protein [Anaerostipes amylophilus]MCU6780908.1 bifunctional folylpolyglutamate synthase/dihydrofolate synthase [Anaerostipes amylophilus]CUN77287.1 Folylpolyglutamate synthase [Anaerostipes hadrus]
MNYEEAMNFIQNTNKFGSVLGLDNIRELLERLGNPQEQLRVVHIAGTNGKGSTLAFLAGIFRESGYRAGRYVSPASFYYEERFRINEENISKKDLCFYMEKIKNVAEEMVKDGLSHPTMFEIETALSFLYFLDKKVDVVLLETGMGGRLDATNVVKKPIATVIASIGMDHMQFLGDTLEKIASEKAGIIKEGCPVISYDNTKEVNEVIKNKAKQMHAKVTFVNSAGIRVLQESLNGESFSYRSSDGRWYEKIEIPLLGRHQINNAALALETLNVIKNYYCISDFQTEDGMRKTIWRGRIEILEREPMVICDGAHNPDGAKSLLSFLQNNFTNQRLIYIMGVLSDKDYEQMVQILAPAADKIYTVAPDNPRALSSRELCNCISKYHQNVEERQRLAECLSEVRQKAEKDDVIIICGTLSFQNELINQ